MIKIFTTNVATLICLKVVLSNTLDGGLVSKLEYKKGHSGKPLLNLIC